MGSIKEINGDLVKLALEKKFDIIIQGCNCFCAMNSGLAKSIKDNFGAAVFVDSQTKKGDFNKLGNYTKTYEHGVWIYNCYTQYKYGTDSIKVDYEALTLCLRKINHEKPNKSIGVPMIGCGLAGGDWELVREIIEKELKDMEVTIVYFSPI